MIGVMKRKLSKVIGRSILTFEELEEVILDIDCSMNNRPLCYQGEEFEQLVITPNILLRGKPAVALEQDLEKIGTSDKLPKRMRVLIKRNEQLKKWWMKEYLYALKERYQK